MPLLEYKCPKCGQVFEELVKSSSVPVNCPKCDVPAVRNYSGTMYTATGQTSHKCSGNCATCKGCGK